MNGLGAIQTPDLAALLQAVRGDILRSINCHQVGTIVSFDAAKQTARVQLMMQRVVFNQAQELGAALQTTPTVVAYPVLVDCPVFTLSGGGGVITLPVVAGDDCLVLFNDRDIDRWWATGASAPPNSQRAHSLSDGFVLVGVRPAARAVANYSTTDIELRYNGGKIQVSDKLGLSNAATSLLSALQAVITALNALNSVKTGGSASVQITAAQNEITSLLK